MAHRKLALALLGAALLFGCGGGPFFMFPGGSLSGEVAAPPEDWSSVESAFMDLEVRPGDPYSVTINYFVREGALYIDPAPDRTWGQYLEVSDQVRVRFDDGLVYELRAVKVSEPGTAYLDLDADRVVYRLEAR